MDAKEQEFCRHRNHNPALNLNHCAEQIRITIRLKKLARRHSRRGFFFAIALDFARIGEIKEKIMKIKLPALIVAFGALAFNAVAWDYENHHAINELALASLPKDFGIDLTPA